MESFENNLYATLFFQFRLVEMDVYKLSQAISKDSMSDSDNEHFIQIIFIIACSCQQQVGLMNISALLFLQPVLIIYLNLFFTNFSLYFYFLQLFLLFCLWFAANILLFVFTSFFFFYIFGSFFELFNQLLSGIQLVRFL